MLKWRRNLLLYITYIWMPVYVKNKFVSSIQLLSIHIMCGAQPKLICQHGWTQRWRCSTSSCRNFSPSPGKKRPAFSVEAGRALENNTLPFPQHSCDKRGLCQSDRVFLLCTRVILGPRVDWKCSTEGDKACLDCTKKYAAIRSGASEKWRAESKITPSFGKTSFRWQQQVSFRDSGLFFSISKLA